MSKPQENEGQPEHRRSRCPITNTLDILGDKWTLIVIRDLFLGKRAYGEFLQSPEGIPTNILAERLKRLETAGILRKEPYQERPVRYSYLLTQKGKALLPVLAEMARWANRYIPGTLQPPRELVRMLKEINTRNRG